MIPGFADARVAFLGFPLAYAARISESFRVSSNRQGSCMTPLNFRIKNGTGDKSAARSRWMALMYPMTSGPPPWECSRGEVRLDKPSEQYGEIRMECLRVGVERRRGPVERVASPQARRVCLSLPAAHGPRRAGRKMGLDGPWADVPCCFIQGWKNREVAYCPSANRWEVSGTSSSTPALLTDGP
jgi:hypothetical protein